MQPLVAKKLLNKCICNSKCISSLQIYIYNNKERYSILLILHIAFEIHPMCLYLCVLFFLSAFISISKLCRARSFKVKAFLPLSPRAKLFPSKKHCQEKHQFTMNYTNWISGRRKTRSTAIHNRCATSSHAWWQRDCASPEYISYYSTTLHSLRHQRSSISQTLHALLHV